MQITIEEKKEYWERVRDSLKILGCEKLSVEKIRHEIQSLPIDDQYLFYHSEPIDIAKDLAGLAQLNQGHILAYKALSEKKDSDLIKSKEEGKSIPSLDEDSWGRSISDKSGSFLHQLIVETVKQTSEITIEIAEEKYRVQRKLLTIFSIFTVMLAAVNLVSLTSTLFEAQLAIPLNLRLIFISVICIVSILSLVGVFLLLPGRSKKMRETATPSSRTRYQVRGIVKAN